MGNVKEKYKEISAYIKERALPFLSDFIFDEKSILINGKLHDTIRMEWVNGQLLKDFIETNLHKSYIINSLAEQFMILCQSLRNNNMSHGDLQEGNIIINSEGNIMLIDYDSVCIPKFEGQKETVTGLNGYQHPSRFHNPVSSLKADYFSELIIYLSLVAFAENPSLWSKYNVKDSCYLLFTENDFDDIQKSPIYMDLMAMSPRVNKLLSILVEYINIKHFTNLVPFTTYLKSPEIKFFRTNKDTITSNGEASLSWEVINSNEVIIDQEIGRVSESGIKTIKPSHSTKYTLKAVGDIETTEMSLNILVLPLPYISFSEPITISINSRINVALLK